MGYQKSCRNVIIIYNNIRNTWTHFPGVSANCLDVDKSHNVCYVGYDNGNLGVINIAKNQLGQKIKGHDGSINGMGINLTNSHLYTVGSDGMVMVWQ